MIRLSIPDMSCGHCSAAVESALSPLAEAIDIDLATRHVSLETKATPADLIAALAKIGFPATEVPR